MMDFNDLARSGTAPEPAKSKINQINSSGMATRPKTRSAENDMHDFNIELRTNRLGIQKPDHKSDDQYIFEDIEEEANEAMQAYFEDMIIARQELDMGGNSAGSSRQNTTSATGRRSARDSKKPPSSHYGALSAYTQNVPQIILQTSKKGSKTANSSPRAAREPKSDVRADLRAVYGVDVLERATASASAQRPRSQKPSSGAAGTIGPSRQSDDSSGNNADATDPVPSTNLSAGVSAGAGRSSSASRLRANVSSGQQQQGPSSGNASTAANQQQQQQQRGTGDGGGNSSSNSGGGGAAQQMVGMKPFSVRKAVPSTSSGPRQATVPRPFSHTEGVRTSVSQGGSGNRASLETPTSSSSSKRVTKKSAGSSSPSPLLKSSLAPSSVRTSSGVGAGGGGGSKTASAISSSGGNSGDELSSGRGGGALQSDHPSYLDVEDYADEVPIQEELLGGERRDYHQPQHQQQRPSAAAVAVSHSDRRPVTDRGASHSAKVSSSRKSADNSQSPQQMVYGAGHSSTGALKRSPPTDNMRDSPVHGGMKAHNKERHSGRNYSRSPTMHLADGPHNNLNSNLNMMKVDSEGVFLDIIQDADGMECSFDDSPILAAYVQQQETRNAQYVVNAEERKDPNSRPQSRKLYLGAEKETNSTSPSGAKSYKTAPRSAGARYSVPDSPYQDTSNNVNSSTDPSQFPLRKMSSFNELIPQTRKWNDGVNHHLPGLRPPSRQSSAFPVHLADEPPTSAAGSRHQAAEAGATSPTSATGVLMSKSAKAATSSSSSSTSNRGSSAPAASAARVMPQGVSSMRWERVNNDPDDGGIDGGYYDDDGGGDEEVPVEDSREFEVDSAPPSEDGSPQGRGIKGGNGFTAKTNSSANNASAVASKGATSGAAMQKANAYIAQQAGPMAASVTPAKEYIGIVRPPLEEDVDSVTGSTYSNYTAQRPPSRQKIAAQHLFDGPPPPSRQGTAAGKGGSAAGSTAAATAALQSDMGPEMAHSRSATARPAALHYNPRDDGFTDLDVNEANVPFVIKFNSDASPDSHHHHHQQQHDRPHRKSASNHNLPLSVANPGTMTGSHSRSSSSASNNWEYLDTEGLLTPLSAHRPQTVQAGQKAPRLLGIYPANSSSYGSSGGAATARSKSAGEGGGVKSPTVPLRREGNNYLMSQQPHAPMPGTLSGTLSGGVSSGGVGGGGAAHRQVGVGAGVSHRSGEYTAGPQGNRSLSSGWTDAEPVRATPRALNVKVAETPTAVLAAAATAGASARFSDDEEDDDGVDSDEMTILTEDSGRHCMESGMSMHSLALDSSLGEDFLSLFAPGPP